MKKKILLVAMLVAMLVCIFAISVSALDYDTSRKVTLDDGAELDLYDASGNALSYYMSNGVLTSVKTADILSTGTATIDGVAYTTFTFSGVSAADMVVVNFQDEKLGDLQVFNTKFQGSTVLEYCYMPKTLERLSVGYDSANVFRETTKCKIVDFPVDCELNFIGKYSFSKAAALKEIYIPANITTFPDPHNGWDWGCFVDCVSLEKVTFAENSQLNKIPDGTFFGCTSLKEITIPDGVEYVGIYAFKNAAFVDSPFTVNSGCKYIGRWAFCGCSQLTNINIPKNATFDITGRPENQGLFSGCTSLTTVNFHPETIDTQYPAYMFSGCTALKEIKLPNTITTQLPVRMFNGCSSLETIILGANVSGFNAFRDFSDHNSFTYGCNSLKYVYLPKTLNISAETHSTACYVFYAGGSITFYFDGSYEEAKKLQDDFKTNVTTCGGQNGKITGATIISLEEYEKLTEIKKCYIVYGGDTCDMFYDGKHETGAPTCGRCGETVYCEDPSHNLEITVAYKSFLENGTKYTRCLDCNTQAVESTVNPLFVCLGYSADQVNGNGFALGFKANDNAIEEYENLTHKTLEYGVFAVGKDRLGDKEVLNADGSGADGVIKANTSNYSYVAFELKIAGFTTDKQKSASLIVGAYVIVGDEISYLQETAPAEGAKYSYVTYNEIVK